MSRFRLAVALAAVFAVGACSDSQSPSTTEEAGAPLQAVLDEAAMAAVDDEALVQAGAGELGTAVRGKVERLSLTPETVFCFDKRLHEFCFDLRSNRQRSWIQSAFSEAIATKFVRNSRAELRLNGRLVAWTNNIGTVFVGDLIGARLPRLNLRVFAGDKLCMKWKGNPAPQVCARLTR